MIESLHSPHIARVKALLGSRGKKERKETGLFIAEGLQFLREASLPDAEPKIDTLYLTTSGRLKIAAIGLEINHLSIVDVTDAVMREMGETVTPQGILALCQTPDLTLPDILISDNSHYIYLHEIQDPGNAGTIVRTADATGFSGVLTSENSVDIYSPKVVRASAGSLWHLPIYEKIDLHELITLWPNQNVFALAADGAESLLELALSGPTLWIFGNEARGLGDAHISPVVRTVRIPMAGNAESLNLAAAAAIVMFRVTSASA
jgi:TrmH family RNA methyltransferase